MGTGKVLSGHDTAGNVSEALHRLYVDSSERDAEASKKHIIQVCPMMYGFIRINASSFVLIGFDCNKRLLNRKC